MSPKTPQEPTEPTNQPDERPASAEPSEGPAAPHTEITLRDGESVSFSAPTDGETHIVVNVVPPQRSIGLFGSCLQGCGCLFVAFVILGMIGSVLGR